MRVKLSSNYSVTVPVTSGVPQGSVLGPVLFLLYVNQVVSRMKSQFKIFADDIKLYLCSGESNDYVSVFQNDISRLVTTSASWDLDMNPSKCAAIRFSRGTNPPVLPGTSPYSINGQYLKFVTSHTDLGVTVDKRLKFHSHINQKTNSAVALTNNILGSVLCREGEFLMNIYRSHVRRKWSMLLLCETRDMWVT